MMYVVNFLSNFMKFFTNPTLSDAVRKDKNCPVENEQKDEKPRYSEIFMRYNIMS